MAAGGGKGLLKDVEGGLLVADEFKDEGVERELEAAEEGVPCGGVAGAGLLDGQMFMVGHGMRLQSGECGGGGKVQMKLKKERWAGRTQPPPR